jgi:signal peptidase complex subunit 3
LTPVGKQPAGGGRGIWIGLILYRGKLELKNQKGKYQITAPSGKIAETDNVVLKLHYNVQPWVGPLTWTPQIEFLKWKKIKGGVSKVFNFPAIKKKEPKKATS